MKSHHHPKALQGSMDRCYAQWDAAYRRLKVRQHAGMRWSRRTRKHIGTMSRAMRRALALQELDHTISP